MEFEARDVVDKLEEFEKRWIDERLAQRIKWFYTLEEISKDLSDELKSLRKEFEEILEKYRVSELFLDDIKAEVLHTSGKGLDLRLIRKFNEREGKENIKQSRVDRDD